MGLFGVTGCGADNEADGKAAGQKLGDPGKPDPTATPIQGATPPKTNEGRKPAPITSMPDSKRQSQPAPK